MQSRDVNEITFCSGCPDGRERSAPDVALPVNPPGAEKVGWEVELGVVIGRASSRVLPEKPCVAVPRAFRKIQLAAVTFRPAFPSLAPEPLYEADALRPARPAAQPERTMPYLISPGAGIAVGLLHHLVREQSPAPPPIALAGLLGLVVRGHAIPLVHAQLRALAAQVRNAGTVDKTVEATTCSPCK